MCISATFAPTSEAFGRAVLGVNGCEVSWAKKHQSKKNQFKFWLKCRLFQINDMTFKGLKIKEVSLFQGVTCNQRNS